jgi:hypothetical protein
MQRLLLLVVLGFMFAGCGSLRPWTKLESKEYIEKRYGFAAEYPKDWYRYNAGDFFAMTKDGLLLNKIAVERKKFTDKLEFTKRKFAESMTAEELAEVEIDNLKTNPAIKTLNILKNEPAAFLQQDAFRIEYECVSAEGLRIHGIQLGFIKDKWVYRIVFEAPSQYYFAENQLAFDHFLASFRLL